MMTMEAMDITNVENDIEHLKVIASIIEYRCVNILKTSKLLEEDIVALYLSKNQHSQDKICEDIYSKMEYMEILLSKIIDDVMTVEIMELDKIAPINTIDCLCHTNVENHSYQ